MTSFDLITSDATFLAAGVRSRDFSARALVEATLRRIDALEPRVNAFREVTAADALKQADRVDALSDGELSSRRLAGVPMAIKDDTDVVGRSTMWGSSVDRGRCDQDAEVVGRLRRAGAIVVGKTNVPELTLWPWTHSQSWGTTRNPWDLERTPGGSSGGSAAAVCSGMAAIGLGSDGGGSVRYPAGLTGLVGVKPQRDRVPVGPEHGSAWYGLVVPGALTRSVRDAALFLDVVADPGTPTSFAADLAGPPPALRVAASANPPPGSQATLSDAGRATFDAAVELLVALGHHVEEVDLAYSIGSLWSSTVRFLKGVEADVGTMPDRDRLEARTRAVARLSRLVPDWTLSRALAGEERIAARINRVFEEADVVLTPLCATPAPRLADCPDRGALRSLRAANTSAWLVPWNLIGQPALSVPLGVDERGLPAAVHLAGPPGEEARLLALAAQIQRARPFPRWPVPSALGGGDRS